jgi:hypothetical protein
MRNPTLTPTYKEFRAWALAHDYTPETLKPHVQAGDPFKTAVRILIHLAGTHWDNEPLPYPKLCALYNAAQEAEPPKAESPKPLMPLLPLPPTTIVDPAYAPWLALWESGWSFQKIADAWTTLDKPIIAADVERTLNDITLNPDRASRLVPSLPSTEIEAKRFRDTVRLRFNEYGWTVPQLVQHYFYLGESYVRKLVSESYETLTPKTLTTRKLNTKKHPCQCGCGKRLTGRQRYASPACRMRASRRRERQARTVAF